MTVATQLPIPPRPTWEQSDNNLLPMWMQYLNTVVPNELKSRLEDLEGSLATHEEHVTFHSERIQELKQALPALKESLKRYSHLLEHPPTDEEIYERYEAIITSPHVIGTRTDMFGDLVVLVDPRIPGYEDFDLGLYEIGREIFSEFEATLIYGDTTIYDYLGRKGRLRGRYRWCAFDVNLRSASRNALVDYDLEPAIDDLIAKVEEFIRYYGYRHLPRKADRVQADLPWSGHHITDPVGALKRLTQSVPHPPSLAMLVEEAEDAIRSNEQRQHTYAAEIRSGRKAIRELKVDIAKQKRAMEADKGVNAREARKSLAYISNLEGVIAIVFRDGVPVLHVRNSSVVNGHRYDLGDFELHLEMEQHGFGTVFKVRRTRVPLGGSYEQGWHPDAGRHYQGGFCFGNRSDEILRTFRSGDIAHAVNLALGTMNSIDARHQDDARYRFQEIPMNAIWTRRIRRRPRRVNRAQRALGQKALEMV